MVICSRLSRSDSTGWLLVGCFANTSDFAGNHSWHSMLAGAETLVILTIRRDPKMLPNSWANIYAKPADRSQINHCAHCYAHLASR